MSEAVHPREEGSDATDTTKKSSKRKNDEKKRATSVYSRSINHANCQLLGPAPAHKLGPRACLLVARDFHSDDIEKDLFLQDPTSQFLHWKNCPENVLIIKKVNDVEVTENAKQLARWLVEEKSMNVFVENNVLEEEEIADDESFRNIKEKLLVYRKDGDGEEQCNVDLIICLGGDGTLIHTSSLFQESCPPVVSFHLGTLGFLMTFDFDNFKQIITQTLKGKDLSHHFTLDFQTECTIKVTDSKNMFEQSFNKDMTWAWLEADTVCRLAEYNINSRQDVVHGKSFQMSEAGHSREEGSDATDTTKKSSKRKNDEKKRATSVYSRSINHANCQLLGPAPAHKLGPRACLLVARDFHSDDIEKDLFLQDPTSQFLHWKNCPENVLIIKKVNDVEVTENAKQLARWLVEEKSMNVFVENNVLEEEEIADDESFRNIKEKLLVYRKDGDGEEQCNVDLIICLGGDGTLIHTSSLFQESCPPVVSFHLGTLGFLMTFDFDNFKQIITQTLKENVGLTLRSRLKCKVIQEKDGENTVLAEHLTLNEVVIDRGRTASLVILDILCNGQHLTKISGDGLIIATATGSTAYSAAAGASMVHPSVPCIIITPLCPHSLSFRPIIVPAGVELKVKKTPESRSCAWASFDGRNSVEITDSILVRLTTSIYPLPCVSHKDHLRDWFDGLAECLQWNTKDFGVRRRKNDIP
ncbi:uncharacterized protein LOC135688439 [Rhopilema esculentum]|uniref:uncharacterized protein LOC135688439 n=1 Tax=Rhopilema esculentum TaxID=499914 RepID=UPI0031E2D2CD